MEEQEMKDRIRELMIGRQMSQKDFASFIGINEATLSLVIRGKNQPNLKIYEAIHKHFPDISMEWLLDGSGPMYKTDVPNESHRDNSTSPLPESSSPSLFSTSSDSSSSTSSTKKDTLASGVAQPIKEVVKYIDKPSRKITEIRVFYDDQTWESFSPKH